MNEINNNDTISLQDVILTTKSYINEIKTNWRLVGLILLLATAFFLYRHYTTPIAYKTESRFIIEGTGGSSGLSGFLGQFGVKSGGKFNPYKVVEVAKSKNLFKKVFFTKYNSDFIINHIIKVYELNKVWGKNNPKWLNFKFTHNDFSKFNDMENLAFMNIFNMTIPDLNKSRLLYFLYDEEKGVFTIRVDARDADLALNLTKEAYEELRKFFEVETVVTQVQTSAILKAKADSLQALIVRKNYQIADVQDRTLFAVQATPNIKREILSKEIQALTMAYSEIMKSYELADINLRDNKPMFILIDESMPPLPPHMTSLLESIIRGLLFGLFLSAIFISARKLYRDSLNTNKIYE